MTYPDQNISMTGRTQHIKLEPTLWQVSWLTNLHLWLNPEQLLEQKKSWYQIQSHSFWVSGEKNKLDAQNNPFRIPLWWCFGFSFLWYFPYLIHCKNSPPPSWHPKPSSHTLNQTIWPHSLLKSLPFGHECLSEGCGLGASAEGSTP